MIKRILIFLVFFLIPCFTVIAKEGRYYEKLLTGDIQCTLCPRECVLKEGQTGTCLTRKNEKGVLQTIVYAQACSVHIDPVEKKPLFHFLPGTPILSVATAGCTLRCVFCQNWNISQTEPGKVESLTLYPEQIVKLSNEKKCPSIAYTYSEPTAFYEYMYDTAYLARQNKTKNVWITCGYINPEPLRELCKVIDAANVDLKGFSDKVYRQVAAAKLGPILETLKILKEKGVWLEVGYLVIPTVNDSREEIGAMVKWVRENLGTDVPLHFLRFFPQHKMTNLPQTPIETLEDAYESARAAGMNYVYIGNVPGHRAENTYCPKCKKTLIERKGYFVSSLHIDKGLCKFCGHKIAGVWQ